MGHGHELEYDNILDLVNHKTLKMYHNRSYDMTHIYPIPRSISCEARHDADAHIAHFTHDVNNSPLR